MDSGKLNKDNEFGISTDGTIEFRLQNENGKESYSFNHDNGKQEIHFRAEKRDSNENPIQSLAIRLDGRQNWNWSSIESFAGALKSLCALQKTARESAPHYYEEPVARTLTPEERDNMLMTFKKSANRFLSYTPDDVDMESNMYSNNITRRFNFSLINMSLSWHSKDKSPINIDVKYNPSQLTSDWNFEIDGIEIASMGSDWKTIGKVPLGNLLQALESYKAKDLEPYLCEPRAGDLNRRKYIPDLSDVFKFKKRGIGKNRHFEIDLKPVPVRTKQNKQEYQGRYI